MLPPIKRPVGRPKGSKTVASSPSAISDIKPRRGPKLPQDPIRRFLLTQGFRYTYGTLPDLKTRVPDVHARHLELKKRTTAIVVALGGDNSVNPFGRQLRQKALGDKSLYRSMSAIRELNMRSLAHIANIRDALHEIEREIWINLELAHDPDLAPDVEPRRRRKIAAQRRRAAIIKGETPPHTPLHVLMPKRLMPVPGDELTLSTDLAADLLPPDEAARAHAYKMKPSKTGPNRARYEIAPEDAERRSEFMRTIRKRY